MPIRIRWGVPGSYKTSKAVEWVIEQLKAGRPVITNVRGLTKERVCKSFGFESDVPFFNLEDEPIGVWLGMWQWAPDGYYFLLDEAQLLFPTNLKDVKEAVPAGFQTRAERGDSEKFTDHFHYWIKHRHASHDIDLTCPDIAEVNKQLRGVIEKAYWQTNQATRLGRWGKGRCFEVEHDPKQSPVNNKSNRLKTQTFTIDKRLFDCYESTATGVYKDTTAVSAAYLTPKFIFALVFVLLIVIYLVFFSQHQVVNIATNGLDGFVSQSKYKKPDSSQPQPQLQPQPSLPQGQPQPRYLPPPPPPPPPSPYKDLVLPPDLLYCGYANVSGKRYYALHGGKGGLSKTVYTANDVDAMGYKVAYLSSTMIILAKDDKKIFYSCTVNIERYNPKTGSSQPVQESVGFFGQAQELTQNSFNIQQDAKIK